MVFLTICVSISIVVIIILICTKIEAWFNGPQTDLTHSMKGKKVVITGASRGIGLETAKDLVRQGATVIMGNRNEDSSKAAIKTILNLSHRKRLIYKHLDLTDYEDIKKFVKEIKEEYGKIDILINNAGSCFKNFTLSDGIELTYFTNHLGHLILSFLLLENFNEKGRIINLVTTKYQRISESVLNLFTSKQNLDFSHIRKGYDWMETYVFTKLASVHLSQFLSNCKYIEKKKIDVKVVSVHPGFINNWFFREIEKKSVYWAIRDYVVMLPSHVLLFKDNVMGAQTTLHCAYMKWEELVNGGYYRDCRYEPLKKIGLLENAKKTINFDKWIIEKNDIVKQDNDVMKIFD